MKLSRANGTFAGSRTRERQMKLSQNWYITIVLAQHKFGSNTQSMQWLARIDVQELEPTQKENI